MKTPIFETWRLKFEQSDWARNPEFGLMDTILERHPELIKLLTPDIVMHEKQSKFGRKDIPSVEQIVRAAIYKELKGLNYRQLEYDQSDSRICSQFVKLDTERLYSFQMYQNYIGKIKAENLEKLLMALNRIAISEGLEDLQKMRVDSTVVETNIHWPTNNSLVWDCIKESHRLLSALDAEIDGLNYRDYTKGAKSTFFKINNTKSKDKRIDLFNKQLAIFTKSINQVSNAVKKKSHSSSMLSMALVMQLESILPVMLKVYQMTYRKEIKGEKVESADKVFSIYEQHTDIIVKGGRTVEFGHKINLATGKSNLVLICDITRGNPADSKLYTNSIDMVKHGYGETPRDISADGGYASKENLEYAKGEGIVNIVFNKLVGSLKSQTSSKNMETRLKKWRSGIEANISNLKRGFKIARCNWKGWAHFQAKVLWSAIGYNIRVMTSILVSKAQILA
jgi:IS5 family transposase